jgi:hypothetical protein
VEQVDYLHQRLNQFFRLGGTTGGIPAPPVVAEGTLLPTLSKTCLALAASPPEPLANLSKAAIFSGAKVLI